MIYDYTGKRYFENLNITKIEVETDKYKKLEGPFIGEDNCKISIFESIKIDEILFWPII